MWFIEKDIKTNVNCTKLTKSKVNPIKNKPLRKLHTTIKIIIERFWKMFKTCLYL